MTTSHDDGLFLLIFLLLIVVLSYLCDADFHGIILSAPETPDDKSAPSLMKISSNSLDKRSSMTYS